jgi:probable F420-dependent oxidoreductase
MPGAAGRDDHPSAGCVQHTRKAFAQPARGTGDDGNLVVEPEQVVEVDGRHGSGAYGDSVRPVKIRIGFGLGTRTVANDAETFGPLVDELERLRFDSLWLSERVTGDAPDPLAGLAFAAGRTTKLKLGTSVLVLPGRNPVLVAKELASIDRLSGGRLLPAFGLGVADPVEQQAFGVERPERAKRFDEALPLLRRLWSEDAVDHHGAYYSFDGVSVLPKPTQQPLDIWLGGIAPSELRRVGRLGDGWLPSFCTVDEVRSGIPQINQVAAEHGREIDPEHFGVLLAYRDGPVPDLLARFLEKRRPGLDASEVVPERGELVSLIERFLDAGASKFVVLPLVEPNEWPDELGTLADLVLPLQN